ncbi:MAG: REP-associated tyrosine transposase [Panacagrimonas sp.]
MARLPRLIVPGYPHHLLQRGNNRQPIFHEPGDYQLLLALLAEYAQRKQVAVHAYVLMPDHLHLLATPESPTALSGLMQALGRRYVQYFNARYARRGTLWEGRFKAVPIQPERDLLDCMTYLDLNPVRAGIVTRASDYPWSSHAHYLGANPDRLVTPHALYWGLGNTPFAREAAYAERVRQGISLDRQRDLVDAVLKGWAVGDASFVGELQAKTSRRVTRRKAGRPRSTPKTPR